MAEAPPSGRITCVVFALDGTLLDTESLVEEATREVVEGRGVRVTREACQASAGLPPLEAWRKIRELLGLQDSAEDLLREARCRFDERYVGARLLPGAERLLRHLKACGVALGLATSSSRASLELKAKGNPVLLEVFDAVVCEDDAPGGGGGAHVPLIPPGGPVLASRGHSFSSKPDPAIYEETFRKLSTPPEATLVIEHTARGVLAARRAGARTVALPARGDELAGAAASDGELASLLAFDPEPFGIPPFDDVTVPDRCVPLLEPFWKLDGQVVRGFGRGSSQLGIPTANLDARALAEGLSEAVTGVYAAWARVDPAPAEPASAGGDAPGEQVASPPADASRPRARPGTTPEASEAAARSPFGRVLPACLSVGYNPTFGNTQKTCEPWILADFDGPFYGARLRLAIAAYIRPELKFESLDALISRIHEDAEVTRRVLADPAFARVAEDPFLLCP